MGQKYLEGITSFTEKHTPSILIVTHGDTIDADYFALLEYLNKGKKYTGVIINFRRPSTREREAYKEKDLDVSKMSFIDGITVSAESLPKDEGIFFLLKPSDLDGLKIGIDSALTKQTTNFVVLDLLDALLDYNSIDKIQKTLQYLKGKAKEKSFSLFVFANGENKSLLDGVTDLFDAKIHTEGGDHGR